MCTVEARYSENFLDLDIIKQKAEELNFLRQGQYFLAKDKLFLKFLH